MAKTADKRNEYSFVPCIAEFIATLVFALIGAGSIVAASLSGSFDGMAIAAAHGFTIFIMVSATASVSGGHINPIVTFAAVLRDLRRKDIHLEQGIGIITSQLLGASIGALMLYGVVQLMDGGGAAADAVNYGTPALANGVDIWGGFILEMIFGFVLVFVVLRTAMEDNHSWAPLAIGMTVFVLALMGGSLTGAAMNPARWFGPALVSGHWDNWWIYAFAPMIGAVIAVITNDLISERKQGAKK